MLEPATKLAVITVGSMLKVGLGQLKKLAVKEKNQHLAMAIIRLENCLMELKHALESK